MAADWPAVLGELLAGQDLDSKTAAWAMGEIMVGAATPAQIAGFVVALRAKGETATEVSGLVEAMLAAALRIVPSGPALDVVGTGGDRSHTVNISTMAALVAAGAGIPVIKHGNRAASSQTGTADVLEELGVAISLSPDAVRRCTDEVGIGFCFAAAFHPAMRHAATTRRELGVPTVFNVLGPLANPAQPAAALVGCADLRLAPVLAQVLAMRGTRALVVRGTDGLDEITTYAPTSVWDVTGDGVVVDEFDTADLGIGRPVADALRGGDAHFNATVLRELLAGGTAGNLSAVRDAVLVNAAAALVAFDTVTGSLAYGGREEVLVRRVSRAMPVAAAALDSGAAERVLDRWIELSSALA
ncbi:MAG: anthranilate phosphoribosyltransferase [Actinomycetes bacterium]